VGLCVESRKFPTGTQAWRQGELEEAARAVADGRSDEGGDCSPPSFLITRSLRDALAILLYAYE
jgi:hypothetical protein